MPVILAGAERYLTGTIIIHNASFESIDCVLADLFWRQRP
jgi:hypothetical protein